MNSSVDLTTISAEPPPPGLSSNFIDPPSLLEKVIAATVIIQGITLIFILLRIYENTSSRQLHAEDYLSYLSYLAFIAYTTITCINASHGVARHAWDVPMPTAIEGAHRRSYGFICYTVCGGFAKATVFMQFKRIFTSPKINDAVCWAITASLVVNALAYTAFLFLYIFTCRPREKIWDPSVPGRCMDSNHLNIAMGGLNSLSDVEAFLVPVWAVWKMQIEVRKKVSIMAVFAVGAVAVAIGCLGLYYRVLILRRADETWFLAQTAIICMAELGIVIIVGCCPYIPRILRKHRPLRPPQFIFGQNEEKRRSDQSGLGKLSLRWDWSATWTSGEEGALTWWPEEYARGEELTTSVAVVNEVEV
ncbi:hypothetical protein P171DRAFT_422654 [Karstenula rhodostoma CBS 690.94]|uniref:Rhodopsin domain-containing protein n=1 Tax=Karstenula rhodostoma CBS 690.94 TaxID=1392251 RepID=A0A9P4U7E1_9PLEO|nr:hypothetical protein P171DRAFT_422654 [Karstenula rhodostoma CBS 690.94]